MFFDELDLNDDILDALDDMQFVECTPIQEKAIPVILDGHDLLGSAQTGTGKTAAYLLPLLELLSRGKSNPDKVNALILVPTRELAQQVDQLLGGFAYYQGNSWIAVYGGNDGVAFAQQQRAFSTGGDIVIATPGRLLSLIRSSNIDMSGIDYLIIDEADRMLDIGFYDDIMDIISYLKSDRQTLLFSATFPKNVELLAHKVLNNPVKVKIAVSKPADRIEQGVYILDEVQKIPLITTLLTDSNYEKTIIFVSSKSKVKDLFFSLKKRNLNVAQIHSDLDNTERSNVLLDFKNGKIEILVATDVVSRGIDIDDIDLVINFDAPSQPEDYVHRIGRTARAGAQGKAIMLINSRDIVRLHKIERFIKNKIVRLSLPYEITALAPPVEEKDFNIKSMNKSHSHSHKSSSTKHSNKKYYNGKNSSKPKTNTSKM